MGMPTYFIALPAPLDCYDDLVPRGFEPIPLGERHLTLLYLGPRDDVKAEAYRLLPRALAGTAPFTLSFEGLQPFPGWSRIIYLAAVPRRNPSLAELHGRIEAALAGLSGDRWETFRPHVSIARTREKTVSVRQAVEEAVGRSRHVECRLEAGEVAVYMASAGRYTRLRSFRLRG